MTKAVAARYMCNRCGWLSQTQEERCTKWNPAFVPPLEKGSRMTDEEWFNTDLLVALRSPYCPTLCCGEYEPVKSLLGW